MIRILHIVANDKLSGAEKVVLDICKNINREYECIAITSGHNLGKYFKEAGIKYYVSDISKLNPKNIIKIRSIIKEENINIVHGHDVKASIAGYLATKGSHKIVISHIHATYPWMKGKNVLKYIDRFFRNRYYASIACSKTTLEYYLQNNTKSNKAKFNLISNSFDFNELESKDIKDKETIRKELKIDPENLVYGYAGRLIPLKGVDIIIKAFYQVQKQCESSILVIIGDGEEETSLKQLVSQLKIKNKVIFTGYEKNIYDYINSLDVFILSSQREGLPMVILEAAALKKAIITTPLPGVMEFIENNQTGIVLESRDVNNLTQAMIILYNNTEAINSLGERAYHKLKEQYNINSYINKLTELYDRCQ